MSSKEDGEFQLYTASERLRRDNSRWTLVQGILAPLQFVVFLASACLVIRALYTQQGVDIAQWSVIIKTLLLYAIMITGCLWEREVFGRYLFAPAFFWEDVVSLGVMALHTLYVLLFLFGADSNFLLWVAVAAYLSYVVNAWQFVYKFRLARSNPSVPARKASDAGNANKLSEAAL